MAGPTKPDDSGQPGNGRGSGDDDLERRRRELGAKLATKVSSAKDGEESAKPGRMAGMGAALRLSSEFIAGVAVGAAIGLGIDWWLGTSPWGLVIFLLLGFTAGVLNVLRSAGVVAEPEARAKKPGGDREN